VSNKSESPTCTNCKWMTRATSSGKPLCERPGLGRRNVVPGGMLYPACDGERDDDFIGPVTFLLALMVGRNCGPNARYFQPKETKP